jgi:hypothetical protein
MTAHSSAGALKNLSTAERARSTRSMVTDEAGLLECGFPKTCDRSTAAWRSMSDRGLRLPAV